MLMSPYATHGMFSTVLRLEAIASRMEAIDSWHVFYRSIPGVGELYDLFSYDTLLKPRHAVMSHASGSGECSGLHARGSCLNLSVGDLQQTHRISTRPQKRTENQRHLKKHQARQSYMQNTRLPAPKGIDPSDRGIDNPLVSRMS